MVGHTQAQAANPGLFLSGNAAFWQVRFEVLGTAPAHLWLTGEGAPGLPESYIGELNWVAERLGGADMAENRERYAHGYAVMGAFSRGRGEVFTVGCTEWAHGLVNEIVSQLTRNLVSRYVKL
ncbi:MAG: hypothetical protein GY724_12955 [Actinomycetia bacterium]|nr:hypothetical protein [Actinomycetes bacterium]